MLKYSITRVAQRPPSSLHGGTKMSDVVLKEGRNLANSLTVRVIKEALARSSVTAPPAGANMRKLLKCKENR